MTSPLAGSLARTLGSALSSTFLPATLVRGNSTYTCRAIFDGWGKQSGPGGALTSPDVKALVLATTLAVEPSTGDIVSLQGSTFVVLSNSNTKTAVSTDPARAVWTLIGKFVTPGTGLTADLNASYVQIAAALGQPFDLYRPLPAQPPLVSQNKRGTLPAVFTSAKASGFSFGKSQGYEDVLWNVLVDGTQILVGDYLVGAGATYFVAAMPPLLPISCVECNRVIGLVRPSKEESPTGGAAPGMPSQPNGTGTYWGASSKPVTGDTLAGEMAQVTGVPVNILGTTGRATGTGELPSDAPGPSRWRIAMPISTFPKGSVRDRDVIIDEEGSRYQISASNWTPIGYRCEAIKLEN